MLVDGVVIDTLTLDADDNGNGVTNSTFSTHVFENIAIEQGQTVTIRGTRDSGEFARIDAVMFEESSNNANAAPIVATPLEDQSSPEDTAVSFAVPAGAFADADGDTLTLSATLSNGDPLPAWLSFDGATFSGMPPQNFSGTLDVTVTASDGSLDASDTFALEITSVNDDPVAEALSVTGDEDTVISGNVLAADVDGDALSFALDTDASNGTAVVNADGSFTYTPAGDFNGIDSFTFTVDDGNGGTTTEMVSVTVNAANDAPTVAGVLAAAATEDGDVVTLDLLEGAMDVDNGATLSIAVVGTLPNGLTVDGTTLRIDPSNVAFQALAADETLELEVSYNITDGDGGSVSQTATVTITGTNDAPTVAGVLAAAATEDGDVVTLDLLEGAMDVDNGATLSIAVVGTLPAGLTVDGTTLRIDPSNVAFQALAADETLELEVSYNITDGDGGSVSQTATVTITGTNDAPTVAGVLAAAATEDGDVVTLDLLEGATDVDNGATLSIAVVGALPEWIDRRRNDAEN